MTPYLSPTRSIAALLLMLGSVSCDDAVEISLEVNTGKEEGVFAADPAVTSIEIRAVEAAGELVLSAEAAPGGSFDLGELPSSSIVTFELTGKTADGSTVMRGRSVSVPVGAVDGNVLPLFMQRLDTLARPSGDLIRAHVNAPGGVLAERYLVLTGGDAAFGESGGTNPALGDYYDMLTHTGSESGAALPRTAKSLVTLGTRLLLIDEGGASFADLTSGTTGELVAPEGLSFAEVSSGRSLERPDGSSAVVGATREIGATNAVLLVALDGSLSTLRLESERLGAATAYIEGDRPGILVAGGSATGAGAEIVRDDGSVTPLPFAPDPVTGAAAVSLGDQRVALLGGIDENGNPAPARVLELGCVAMCQPQIIAGLELPEIAVRGRAFAMSNGLLVFGDGPLAGSSLYRVSLGDAQKSLITMREARTGATPIAAPNGTLAIVGGTNSANAAVRSVEFYFPE